MTGEINTLAETRIVKVREIVTGTKEKIVIQTEIETEIEKERGTEIETGKETGIEREGIIRGELSLHLIAADPLM